MAEKDRIKIVLDKKEFELFERGELKIDIDTPFEVVNYSNACNEKIKELRINHGLSQSDLAKILGITQQEYWRYEQDGYAVNISKIASLAVFYNVSIDWISGCHPIQKKFYNDKSELTCRFLNQIENGVEAYKKAKKESKAKK